MKHLPQVVTHRTFLPLLVLSGALAGAWVTSAAPTILSSEPANMAVGVSPASTIRVTFSEAMEPVATSVMVLDANTSQMLSFLPSWTVGNTILTCTLVAGMPANHMIVWLVDGVSAAGEALTGSDNGMFTTGGGSTGCDTNAPMASFTAAKGSMYAQDSTTAPLLNTNAPYCFLACMSLPCPRDATNISLQLPGGSLWNDLALAYPGHLTLTDCGHTDPNAFEGVYPAGNYNFKIQSVGSNQQVSVNFPSTLTQPTAPHLDNYLADQAINPNQPFILSWDPWSGGTKADCIYVEVYGNVFHTPALGVAGALDGTATSVTIPVGAFQPNQQYSGCVTFYHYVLVTNATFYLTLAYRASTTEFSLRTTAGSPSLILSNCGWSAGAFRFDVTCNVGQALVAEYSTNLASHQWSTLCSTSSPVQRVRFTDSQAAGHKQTFYRVRPGP